MWHIPKYVILPGQCDNPSYCLMLDDPWFHGSNIIVLCSGSIITPAYMVSKGRHSSSPFLCAVLPPSICARVNIRSLACHYRCCRYNELNAEKRIIFCNRYVFVRVVAPFAKAKFNIFLFVIPLQCTIITLFARFIFTVWHSLDRV